MSWRTLIAAVALALPSASYADELTDLTLLRAQLAREFSEWKIVAVCGASSGQSYFMQELQKGWQTDQISSGKLIFIRDDTGKPDVIFLGATRGAKSATLEGARVIELFSRPSTQERLAFIVRVYGNDRNLFALARRACQIGDVVAGPTVSTTGKRAWPKSRRQDGCVCGEVCLSAQTH